MTKASAEHVGIVIVSHSAKVAEGAADMVRQMVGDIRAARLDRRQCRGRAWHRRRRNHWRRSTRHGRRPASPSSSISAAPRPIAKWPWNCWTRRAAGKSWFATRRSSKARLSLRPKRRAARRSMRQADGGRTVAAIGDFKGQGSSMNSTAGIWLRIARPMRPGCMPGRRSSSPSSPRALPPASSSGFPRMAPGSTPSARCR